MHRFEVGDHFWAPALLAQNRKGALRRHFLCTLRCTLRCYLVARFIAYHRAFCVYSDVSEMYLVKHLQGKFI